MITVTGDRHEIVVKDSRTAKRLESLNASYNDDIHGFVAPKCFNVEHLSWCKRQLVSTAMQPSSYVPGMGETSRKAMDSLVRDIWIRRLNRVSGVKVSLVGHHVVDNTICLHGFVDCMMNTSDLVSNIVFRYASSTEMNAIREKGPYRRDAVSAIMLGYMLHCPDSVVVYGHGRDSAVFHVRRVDAVVDAVKEKCVKMGGFFLSGGMPPPCRSSGCRFCRDLNKEST